ncbi:MAG TPA: hypothetical protein VFF11_04365, partial [Candidatus Binatia bacterium]|nr:hypothetical protein [Candidatus Binatia bacterium]
FRLHPQSVSQKNLELQTALAGRIGSVHCRKFMNLNETDAGRANELLLTSPRDRAIRDWFWFLTRCAPRLRWKSFESLGWLLWQTIKVILRR